MWDVLSNFLDSALFWQFIGGAVTVTLGAGITSVVTMRTVKQSSAEQGRRELAAYERAILGKLATAVGDHYWRMFSLFYMAPGLTESQEKDANEALPGYSSAATLASALAGICRDDQLRQLVDEFVKTAYDAVMGAHNAKAITAEGKDKVKSAKILRDKIYDRIREVSYGSCDKIASVK